MVRDYRSRPNNQPNHDDAQGGATSAGQQAEAEEEPFLTSTH